MEEGKLSVSPLGVPPIASHHERLIGEVEGSDGQLGAILRWALLPRCILGVIILLGVHVHEKCV